VTCSAVWELLVRRARVTGLCRRCEPPGRGPIGPSRPKRRSRPPVSSGRVRVLSIPQPKSMRRRCSGFWFESCGRSFQPALPSVSATWWPAGRRLPLRERLLSTRVARCSFAPKAHRESTT
jgi:hypothetical protein